jgi:hypothetical protein
MLASGISLCVPRSTILQHTWNRDIEPHVALLPLKPHFLLIFVLITREAPRLQLNMLFLPPATTLLSHGRHTARRIGRQTNRRQKSAVSGKEGKTNGPEMTQNTTESQPPGHLSASQPGSLKWYSTPVAISP